MKKMLMLALMVVTQMAHAHEKCPDGQEAGYGFFSQQAYEMQPSTGFIETRQGAVAVLSSAGSVYTTPEGKEVEVTANYSSMKAAKASKWSDMYFVARVCDFVRKSVK